jgi:predicted nucleic-acid-binding protein
MRAVDTNVLVRLITRDDARQLTAAGLFIEDGVWVSILAVAETVWVLRTVYGTRADGVESAVAMLLNHKSLVVQDSDAVTAALELFRSRPGWGFTDCLMLELARKAGHLPLGTFDRDLGKVDGAERL